MKSEKEEYDKKEGNLAAAPLHEKNAYDCFYVSNLKLKQELLKQLHLLHQQLLLREIHGSGGSVLQDDHSRSRARSICRTSTSRYHGGNPSDRPRSECDLPSEDQSNDHRYRYDGLDDALPLHEDVQIRDDEQPYRDGDPYRENVPYRVNVPYRCDDLLRSSRCGILGGFHLFCPEHLR